MLSITSTFGLLLALIVSDDSIVADILGDCKAGRLQDIDRSRLAPELEMVEESPPISSRSWSVSSSAMVSMGAMVLGRPKIECLQVEQTNVAKQNPI